MPQSNESTPQATISRVSVWLTAAAGGSVLVDWLLGHLPLRNVLLGGVEMTSNPAMVFVVLGTGMFVGRREATGGTAGSFMPRSSIARKTFAGYLGTIALLLLTGGFTYRAAGRAAESARLVAHTQEVRGLLGRLYADVADAESAERNYILTGSPNYLEGYRRFASDADRRAQELARLVADNPEQLRRSGKLQSVVAERVAALERNRIAFEQTGFAAARAMVATGGGNQLMLVIRNAVGEMDAVEAGLLASREIDSSRARTRVLVLLILTLGLATAGFTLLFRGIRRELTNRARVEEALRRSEESLAVTLHSIGDAVLATDTTGRITQMNKVGEQLTGWSNAEARNQPVGEVFRIFNEVTREPAVVPVDNVLATGEIHGLANHTVLIARDGTERAIADSAAPIRDRNGVVLGVVLVFRDVTELRRAEEARRASEEQYRTLFSSIDEGFCIIEMIFDEQGKPVDYRFLDLNPSFQTQTGLSDARGKRMRELAPKHEEHWFEIYGRIAMTGEPLRFQNRAEQLSRWYDVYAFRFGEPKHRQVAILFNDITASKQAERMLLDYKAALDAHAIVTVTDPRGKITYANDRFCAISRYSREALLGQDHRIVNSGHHPKGFFGELWETIISGRVWHGEIKNQAKDGTNYWVNSTIVPLFDAAGTPAQYIAIQEDITERRHAEEALGRANAELERGSRLKDEFLANMSHELRTPLNAILGLSEALLEQVSGTLTPRQIKSVTTIFASGQHLLALINDILDLTKIEAGKLELHAEPLQVQEFCESCLTFVHTQALHKNIGVAFECDGAAGQFVADPKRFKQVLVNLLTNAVKFTPTGGRIGLEVVAPKGEDVVRFTVWDTGIGISALEATKLFQAFTQIDSGLTRAQEGTGLGLALVAKLVELHGGSVALESEPDQGSRFVVTLPVPSAAQPPGERNSRIPFAALHAPPRPFRKALIVEDDPTTSEQLDRYLSELKIDSILHARGDNSVDLAVQEKPDVILLDILLPNESGWVVLAKLKEHPGTRDIPVAVISVVDEPQKSRALGAVAHFIKPITRAQLAGFLHRAAVEVVLPDAPSVAPAPARGPLILLAEDNEANIETIGGYLGDRGYALHHAHNGFVAVKLTRELRPALILMDIQMPVMDGLTAIREIRADAEFKDIPIVALTALAMAGDRERCVAAGATEYISKPVNLKALAALVARLLADPGKHDETSHSHDPVI